MTQGMSASETSLAAEAHYLHSCLFRSPPDDRTVQRYLAAHRQLFFGQASNHVARVIERKLDAEAVEFALRRRGAGVELTRKLQIICYLAEVRARYLGYFINQRRSRAAAWVAVALAALSAPWKLAKGEYTIRRNGLL